MAPNWPNDHQCQFRENGYPHHIVMMVIINGTKLDTKDGHRKMNGYPHHIVMMVIINGAKLA